MLSLQLIPFDAPYVQKLSELSTKQRVAFLCYGRLRNRTLYIRSGRVEEPTPPDLPGQGSISSLSPDMRYVAFVKPVVGGPYEIIMVNVEDKSSRELMRWPATIWSLAWSPRGNEIAFIADDRFPVGIPTLYTVDLTNAEVTTLSRAYDQSAPSWSPDGKKIVLEMFHRVEDGDQVIEIVVIDRETRHTQKLGRGYYPSWSPDGNLIAYLDNRRVLDHEQEHICTMKPDGTGKTVLVSAPGWFLSRQELVGPIVWSPDMRYIAYHTVAGPKGGQRNLYVFDSKTKKTEKIYSELDLALVTWKTAP